MFHSFADNKDKKISKDQKVPKEEKSSKKVKESTEKHISDAPKGKPKLDEAGAKAKKENAHKSDASDLGMNGSSPAPTIGTEESSTTKAGMIVTDNVKAPVVAEHDATVPPLEEAYPYPKRDLVGVLQREHNIGSFQLGTTNVRGDLLTTFQFPGDFANIPNIVQKLGNFAYYRSGVQLRFRVSSTAAASGKIKICYLKSCPSSETLADYEYSPWLDPHILDINSAQDLVITIPWFSNIYSGVLPWVFSDSEIARVVCFCEHPLVMSGATAATAITIQLYARLLDLDYWGDIPGAPAAKVVNKVPKDILKKFLAEYASTQSIPDDLGRKLGSAFSDGDTASIFSSLSSTIEAGKALVSGMSMLAAKPLFDGVWKPVVSSKLGHIANSTGVAPVPNIGFHQNVLIDEKTPAFFGDVKEFKTLNDIASMPGPIGYTTYNNTATPGQLLLRIPITPSYCTDLTGNLSGTFIPPPAAFIASNFLKWRGSMKYKLYFSSPQLVASKVMVCYFPNTASLPTTPPEALEDQGEVTGFVVDVIGSVSKDFMIPYLNNVPTITNQDPANIADQNNAGYIEVRVLTPPQGNDAATTTVNLTLEAAAGEDSLWFYPSPRINVLPSIGQTQAYALDFATKQSLNSAFSKPFPALDSSKSTFNLSRIATDSPQGLKELACKPVPFQIVTVTGAGVSWGPISYPCIKFSGSQPSNNDVWLVLSQIFRAFRGSSYVFTDPFEAQDSNVTSNNSHNWVYPVLLNPTTDQYVSYSGGTGSVNLSALPPLLGPTDIGWCIPYNAPDNLFITNEYCQAPMFQPTGFVGGTTMYLPQVGRTCYYRAWADDVKFGGLAWPQAYTYPAASTSTKFTHLVPKKAKITNKAKDKGRSEST